MSKPDAGQVAALSAQVIKPVFFGWLDFADEAVRANSSGASATPAGTGDPDLDGFEYLGVSGTFIDVSPVSYAQGGSKSVTATLSGILGLDDEMLAQIEDRSNWQGRDARLWRIVRNAANVQQGGYHGYYTGKMVALRHSGSSEEQKLVVTIESYLSVFSEASNRTYLDQSRYDEGDESARAAIAIANGSYGAGGGGSSAVGGNGPSSVRGPFNGIGKNSF